jgi:hypothetical protein
VERRDYGAVVAGGNRASWVHRRPHTGFDSESEGFMDFIDDV